LPGHLGIHGLRFGRRYPFVLLAVYVGLTLALVGASLVQGGWRLKWETTIFLMSWSAGLAIASVRLERGTLTLSAIPLQVASLILGPPAAALVGLANGLGPWQRGRWRVTPYLLSAAAGSALWTTLPAALLLADGLEGSPSPITIGVAIPCSVATNLVVTALTLAGRIQEPVLVTMRRVATRAFLAAFVYFALASVLLAYLLDGSFRGFLLGSIVCILSLALTDTIGGRRARHFLEAQLSDADRYLIYSRAVEGVVHNLRNHLTLIDGNLRDVGGDGLDAMSTDSLMAARAACSDAVASLHSLSQSASPDIRFIQSLLDLRELAFRCAALVGPQARRRGVAVTVRQPDEEVLVQGDGMLLREVISNLLINAIEASAGKGLVTITVGHTQTGLAYLRIGDSGPGVPEHLRNRLFEPHFSTKPGGTGMGLFTSYGIVREHRGDLVYEPNPRGAVFTVFLPGLDLGGSEPIPHSPPA